MSYSKNENTEPIEDIQIEDLNDLEERVSNDSFQTFKTDGEHNPKLVHSNHIDPPRFDRESIKRYCVTRFTDLLPTKAHMKANRYLLNPIPHLQKLGRKEWLLFLSAFLAWTWDAYDFFCISLNASTLAKDFDVTVKKVTWGITVVLMLRPVGSIFFGYIGDRYGRKWPLVITLAIVCCLEIGTGFITTYQQFLGVRAAFGIMLGGIYGTAIATGLDDCPKEARGFVSGLLQQGYAFGYLLAVVFNRAIADNTKKQWRALYWFGAGVCFLIACYRAYLPETKAFLKQKEIERYNKEQGIYQRSFKEKIKEAFTSYWLIFIYLVLFMSIFSFMSHGSQDLYPTLLSVRYNFSKDASTVTNCVANIGAIVGGITMGHLSNFLGRRLTFMICAVGGGAMIYPWAFIDNANINAGAFWLQFFVQGAFGVVPAYLSELSPPEFRAFVVGSAYQFGTLTASASSTIETTIGEHFPLTSPDGTEIYDYAKVMAIFIGCVFGSVFIITFVGPERKSVTFDTEEEEDFEINEKIGHHEIQPEDKTVGTSR